jgi:hypothetical protein
MATDVPLGTLPAIPALAPSALQSIGYELGPSGSCRAVVASKEKGKGGGHGGAFDDWSFGMPHLSLRFTDDCPFCIAQVARRGSFEIAPDSEAHFLGPLIHNPGEGLGGPT